MKPSYRLTMMFISLAVILTVGWLSMGNFEFATGQFWFISGALLLVMLSLVDQPHFSKDANVFVNGATALVSLFTIVESQRTGIWWIFCSWAIYLIIASFVLMALRSRELFLETKTVQFFSRVNRAIGRPESIFSAFFLWGVFLQFTYPQITAEFVTAAFAELSKTKLERGKNIPAKLCIVFEEAHSLIPEWNQVAQKGDEHQVNKTARAILQGRKYGMGALIITQRTANVTKTILNQCNTVFALRSFDQTGLDFLRNYMGEEYSQAISTLPRYTAVLVGQASSSSRPIILKISEFSSRTVGQGQPEQPVPEPPRTV